MNYNETQQKLILRTMEQDILAIVAVDLETEEYEVVYSDGTYKDFENRYHKKDFFSVWKKNGLQLIASQDRERLAYEISKENLLEQLSENDNYYTLGSFIVGGHTVYCRIKVSKDVVEPGNVVISIRNVDREVKQAVCVLYNLNIQQKQDQDIQDLKEDLDQMRMKSFVRQIHPHFLYNSLSSIREIVLSDPEYGADMLYDFTTFLRASLKAMTNDDTILFSQELENIKAYINIEKMRLGDKLKVVYDIDAEDFQILPLSVQPIVENAVKHGIYNKKQGGTVTLKVRKTQSSWEILVEDDGAGFDQNAVKKEIDNGTRDSAGLYNLIYRLENKMNASVSIKTEPGKGTAVSIKIPFKQ